MDNMIKVDETDLVGDMELKFPYRQVSIKRGEDVKQHYELSEEIGRGKFGTVYKCKEKSTSLCFAAKFIAVPNRKERKNVEREIEMQNRLHHPKIIQLYDAFEYNKIVCVVLELIDGGELFDRVLDDKFILTEKACSIFMRQICEAMEYIHEHNIIHLDLKPENILCLTESGNRIKIIDFGLAREFDPSTKLQVLFGTPEFVAPEVVNFDAITYATDMWSVGVIAYVLVSGLSPFAGECDVETMGNVTVGKYDFNDEAFDNVSPECIDFITKLLVKEHGERLTAHEALRHKWVKRKPQGTPTNAKLSSSPLSSKAVHSDKDNSLTSAKDNLRNCVDRWNDSTPYVFDKHTKSISSVHSSISSSIEPHSNGGDATEHGILSLDNCEHDMSTQNLNSTQTTPLEIAVESTNGDVVDVQSVKICDDPLDANNNKINDCNGTMNHDNDQRRQPLSNIFKKFSSLADSGNELSNAPWPVSTKRTKFRINQMSSRDVPIFKTEKPAKLQKQNAIDACDTKMFDEQIHHKSIFQNTSPSPGKNSIEQLLESFERDRSQLFQSHFRHKTFIDRMPNGSISFDCGQLCVETRSMNTIRSLLSLHASTGQNVKQIQAKIEAQHK